MKYKKSMSLKRKLALVYILAGFLPVLIILIINLFQMRYVFRDKEVAHLETYINQAVNMLDSKIEIYDNIFNYISEDEILNDIVTTEYLSNNLMYEKFDSEIQPILQSICSVHSDINSMTIYLDKEMGEHSEFLLPMSEISETSWYTKVQSDYALHWLVDSKNNQMILAGRILRGQSTNAVLCITLNYNDIIAPFFEKAVDNYGLFIIGEESEIVYAYKGYDEENQKYILTYNELLKELKAKSNKYQVFKQKAKGNTWTIWMYKPKALMNSDINDISLITAIGIAICMIAAFMCIRFTAVFVTKRIRKLQDAMKLVEKEDFSVELTSKSTDEIGELIRSFSRMEKKLNHLINEVYKSKISEKEYEMTALRAQINPHFLYNTLSLINWKAIEAGQRDISKITLALSAFYRTSLNKGKNIIELSGEIENMRSYLSIQLALHDNDFDVVEDIDESILKCMSLNLILQPIIENAIDHGIDVMPEGSRGKITIRGKDLGDIIELSVIDNGVGMTDEQAAKILTSESKGYGVRNVNERIKLYYGDNFPLIIRSHLNYGTEVVISIPKRF